MKKKKKFELAAQEKTEKFRPYIEKILKILGHSEALVTDQSTVSDFLDVFDKTERERQMASFNKKIGVKICPEDYLWEVAERMI